MRALLLLMAAALPVAAQSFTPFSCTSDSPSGSFRTVRAEGKTELVADVLVTCTGGFPTAAGQPILAANFTLTFDAPVTSRILGSGNLSEALVLIDEPQPGAQYACPSATCTSTGNGTGTGYYGPTGNYNVFQGAVGTAAAANSITWSQVPVDPPGQTVGATRTFRFTNIRLNATGVPPGTTLNLTGITVVGQIPVTSIPGMRPVATTATALSDSVWDAANATPAPAGVPVTLAAGGSTTPARTATLRYSVNYHGAAAPRTNAAPPSPDAPAAPAAQNFPGGFYTSESGFYNPAFPTTATGGNLGIAGLADWGTRLMATFTNIPAGVTVYVSLRNDPSAFFNGSMARLTATDANGAGAFSAVAGNNTIAQLTPVNGSASAVWEVLSVNPETLDTYSFGVWFSYAGGIYPSPPAMNVTMRLAPLAGGIPIFAGAGTTQPVATFTATAPPPPPPTPTFGVAPAALNFTGTAGGNNPAPQSLSISSSPTGQPYGIFGATSLQLRAQPPSGTTPDVVSISLNTLGMAAGIYRDILTVSGPGTSVQVPITLTLAPAPSILGISPSSTIAGSPAFTLAVTGANFTTGSTVTWNGGGLATTFGNATSLTAQVPAALVAKAGTAAVGVSTADNSRSGTAVFTILPFSLTSIDPVTVQAGGPAFTLTASGVGFLPGATLNVGGATAQTLSSSGGSITATVPASAIAQPGTLSVTVSNPGGLTSNALTLTVIAALRLISIDPATVTAGHQGFPFTLTGTGFPADPTVQIGNATVRGGGSASATSITVTVPAESVSQPGSFPVRVLGANGLSSNALNLTVNPPPRLTSLSPASISAGSGFSLTVNGSGLFAGSTVQWNGQSLATSGSGPTQLTAQLPASLIATAATASITVVSFDGVVSNALPFTIGPAATITSLSPSTANVGAAALTLTVTGTNLQQGATVNWNGQGLATSFVSPTTLTAQVPANLLGSVSTANVTVSGATGALPFRVVLPPLTNVGFGAPPNASSGQDQPISLTLGGVYPVDLKVTLTLTFAPDSGLPDDPAIQFQNGSRNFTFTVPAGTPATIPALITKTGTVAGVITITATFTTATGTDVTPSAVAPQRIQVNRAAPVISSVTCSRSATGFTVVIDGYTNTREATQATFDFTAASGQSLGTSQLQVSTTSLFTGWFGSSAASTAGGLFRYTQPFTVSGSATVSNVTVKLGNSVGASAAASCQLQ